MLRKRNIKNFEIKLNKKINLYKEGLLDYENIIGSLQGWFGYAMWADTYKFRREILRRCVIPLIFPNDILIGLFIF